MHPLPPKERPAQGMMAPNACSIAPKSSSKALGLGTKTRNEDSTHRFSPSLGDSFFQVFVQTSAVPRSPAWLNSPRLHPMNPWPSLLLRDPLRHRTHDPIFHHCLYMLRDCFLAGLNHLSRKGNSSGDRIASLLS